MHRNMASLIALLFSLSAVFAMARVGPSRITWLEDGMRLPRDPTPSSTLRDVTEPPRNHQLGEMSSLINILAENNPEGHAVTNVSRLDTCSTSTVTRISGLDRIICPGTVLLEDEFKEINTEKWTVEHYIAGKPDYEFVIYSEEPLHASNDRLEIKPYVVNDSIAYGPHVSVGDKCTRTGDQCFLRRFRINAPIRSARITSKITFSYGDIEIKARLPQGDWIYPEIYLEEDYPGENKTRIYIAYSAGNKQLKGKMFADFDLGGGLLMGGPTLTSYQPDRFRFLRYVRLQEGYYSDDFHTYRLKWTPDSMTFFYDGYPHGALNTSTIESDKISGNTPSQFRLVIGVGVGGMNDFIDNYKSGDKEKPWINAESSMVKNFYEHKADWLPTWGDKSKLEVDYVKIKAL